jgi:PadR family transcriptional regulator, regulatory protein AphA
MFYPISLEGQFRVPLEVAILGFLAERSRSGYDLKTRCFAGPMSVIWTADQAQIYRTLERLREAGHVAVTRRRQVSRPDRRIYEITTAGREALAARLSTPTPLPPLRDSFLVGLFFSAACDDASLVSVLAARRTEHQVKLDELREYAAALASDDPQTASARVTVLRETALEGAMTHHRATIDWLDECIDAVRDGALPGSETGTGQRHLFAT